MPYQQIDVSQTRFFFTSGRYEFSNKGFDTFIESLAKLNGSLQNSHKKVFAFFLVPAAHGSVQPLLLWSRLQYQKIMGDLTQSLLTHASKVFDTYVSRESVPQFTLPGSLHAHLRSFTQEGLPISATHAVDPQTDILRLAHARGLTNKASDAVKLVFVPAYITGLDGIFDVPYYDLTGAMDLGVFASRYEPWGYTPLEANAVGVPTVTTNAAGYGQYCEERKLGGVNVLDRAKSESEVVARLHELLLDYATCDEEVLLERKELALLSAKTCDWKQFVGSYFRAHMLACERMKHDISKT
jgi:glycogen(starch) synthase